ncbi:hypothetical protein OIU76_025318 [Salix suchowensis]|nr:hypothetical protein OIU76_025318 [Salix suchowensis]
MASSLQPSANNPPLKPWAASWWPLPSRPWEQNYSMNNYGGYNSTLNYNLGYGSGMYGSSYGGGLYGNNMHRGGYGGLHGSGMYGGGMYNGGFWISFLRVLQGVVNFFGRISILIDQNTQAFHMFMTALLQLFDRSGMLYGELARFVLRLLRIKTKPRKVHPHGPHHGLPLPGPEGSNANPLYTEGPAPAPSGSWDNVWENDAGK